jgi:hypothetical protein
MSLFNKVNSSRKPINREDIEEELLKTYSRMFSLSIPGITKGQARKEVKKIIEICKKQAKEQGTTDQPENYGDLLLDLFSTGNPDIQKMVDRSSNDGSTIEDFREYWNLPDLSRRMILMSEEVFRYGKYIEFKEKGLSSEQAMSEVRKMFPIYGNPEDTRSLPRDDMIFPRFNRHPVKMGL